MTELIKVVGLAKSRVDAGFSRVGRRLRADDAVDRALMTLAARAISCANALTILCRDGHANEALPLLRAVAESAAAMRWTAAADSSARAAATLAEIESPRWEDLWASARLRERAEAFGLPRWALEAAVDSSPRFARGNAQGLPWGHVFTEGVLAGGAPAEVLAAAAVWLALMLEALDRRWPGDFSGAGEMRDAVQSVRGQ